MSSEWYSINSVPATDNPIIIMKYSSSECRSKKCSFDRSKRRLVHRSPASLVTNKQWMSYVGGTSVDVCIPLMKIKSSAHKIRHGVRVGHREALINNSIDRHKPREFDGTRRENIPSTRALDKLCHSGVLMLIGCSSLKQEADFSNGFFENFSPKFNLISGYNTTKIKLRN